MTAAGYPSTPKIPAQSDVLSLLALKLTSTRRVSHVYDIAADPGAALFAGLTALPKATALTSYSYRLEHSRQAACLAALDTASLAAGLAHGVHYADALAACHAGSPVVAEGLLAAGDQLLVEWPLHRYLLRLMLLRPGPGNPGAPAVLLRCVGTVPASTR